MPDSNENHFGIFNTRVVKVKLNRHCDEICNGCRYFVVLLALWYYVLCKQNIPNIASIYLLAQELQYYSPDYSLIRIRRSLVGSVLAY